MRCGDIVCSEITHQSGQQLLAQQRLTCVTWFEMQNIRLPDKGVQVISLAVFILITVGQVHNVVS